MNAGRMSIEPPARKGFPRWFLIGTALLMALTAASAGLSRLTDLGASRSSGPQAIGMVDLVFDQQADKSVLVRAAADGRILEVLPSDGGGFIRGVLRGQLRQRMLHGVPADGPFQLARRPDGRHFLIDPSIGTRIELDGFGPSNSHAFARLYDAGAASMSLIGSNRRAAR